MASARQELALLSAVAGPQALYIRISPECHIFPLQIQWRRKSVCVLLFSAKVTGLMPTECDGLVAEPNGVPYPLPPPTYIHTYRTEDG